MKTSDNVGYLDKLSFSSEKPKDYNMLLLKNRVYKKIDQTLEVKKFDETTYFDDVLSVVSEYDVKLANASSHEEEHKLHHELVYKIGHINDTVELPNEYKFLVSETRNVVSRIREWEWKFNIWLNSYLVPGSLSSLRKLLEYKVLEAKNASITYWNWVNMQEWVRFVKHAKNWHESAITHFDVKDTIEKLDINLWDNSSIAHSVTFQAKKIDDNHFEYNLKTWENVFLWINAQIGSWVEVGDNTAIWFGTIIKDDVKIGKNVVIWEWVKIKNWIKIPDNCLVPNWAIIRDDFKVIPYEEYKRNELKYDTETIEKRKRRNFVVLLSQDLKEERIDQMNNINNDYTFMSIFNELYVVPENKLFAVINTILAIISKHFPDVNVIKEEEFKSILSLDKLKSYDLWLENSFLATELSRNVKLSLKAFPKDKEEFLMQLLPKVIYAIKNWVDITKEIKEALDYPEIPENKEEVFLWTNTFTWKTKVASDSFVYDTYIRSDELAYTDKVEINNSRIVKWVLHWWGDKILNDSKVVCTVVHWKMNVDNSIVWNYKHHSVYHACDLDELTQESGWVVANWAKLEKSDLGFWVLLMPGASISATNVWDYSIIWNREISNCTIWENSYIWNWSRSFEWVYLSGKVYSIDKNKDKEDLKETGLENI